MICQAAAGDYSLKAGELEKRKSAILAYIRSGQCVASEEDRQLAEKVNKALAVAVV